MAHDAGLKVEFGEWLGMSSGERGDAGLPSSLSGMAERLDVNRKTLSRWKSDPVVVKVAAGVASGRDGRGLSGGPEGGGGSVDAARVEFEEIRRELVSEARAKGGKALETYMRYFGKSLLDEELAAREAGFSEFSDEQLVAEVLSLVGREAVERWLADG